LTAADKPLRPPGSQAISDSKNVTFSPSRDQKKLSSDSSKSPELTYPTFLADRALHLDNPRHNKGSLPSASAFLAKDNERNRDQDPSPHGRG